MPLWTDLIDPATLTGYARASLADYEARKGTLARWLPNRYITDIVARFVAGSNGLVNVAKFRAYDAEPEIGKRPGGKRVTLDLPALGQNIPIGEQEQIRNRSASDELKRASILRTTDIVVRAVGDAMELLRGTVLYSGIATTGQANFPLGDDFGRPAGHTITAGTLWSTAGVDRIGALQTWSDVYTDTNGEPPGALLMSTRVFRALQSGSQFQTQLLNGGARNATAAEVRALLEAAGFPPIYLYDRRVSVDNVTQKAIPDDGLLMLPEPVDTDDWQGTDLGATFWGQTLTSEDPDWGIEDVEQPGIVAGAYKGEKPPMIAEVISDAIGEPVLANSARSLRAKVL